LVRACQSFTLVYSIVVTVHPQLRPLQQWRQLSLIRLALGRYGINEACSKIILLKDEFIPCCQLCNCQLFRLDTTLGSPFCPGLFYPALYGTSEGGQGLVKAPVHSPRTLARRLRRNETMPPRPAIVLMGLALASALTISLIQA
jgi:hypothetical protein